MNKIIGISLEVLAVVFFIIAYVVGQSGYATEVWSMLSIMCVLLGIISFFCRRNYLLSIITGLMLYCAVLSYFLFGILLISLAFLVIFAVLICVTIKKNKKSSN